MNSECDVVMDLAGVYFDKTAAYETEAFIKDHLNRCESCRNFYKQFSKYKKGNKINDNSSIPKWEGNYDEVAYRIRKRRRLANILGIGVFFSMLGIIIWLVNKDD